MSEPQTEPTEPVEPEPVEPEPAEAEAEAEPEAEPEAEAEAEAEPEQSSTSAEQEAAYHALDRKADSYLKGVVKISNDAGLPFAQCELCSDAYPGVRWLEPQNDQARTMLAVIGATGGDSPLNDDPDARLCERCNGYGWTRLPSHVPNNTERMCRACNGTGWLDLHPQSGAPQAPTAQTGNGGAEPEAGVPLDDPAVVDLKARGFMVMKIPTVAGAEQ